MRARTVRGYECERGKGLNAAGVVAAGGGDGLAGAGGGPDEELVAAADVGRRARRHVVEAARARDARGVVHEVVVRGGSGELQGEEENEGEKSEAWKEDELGRGREGPENTFGYEKPGEAQGPYFRKGNDHIRR